MPAPYYRVEADIGAYSYTVEDTDTPGYGLADPLTVSWDCPRGGLVYPQPAAMVATVRVVVASVDDLADLAIGDPVALRVWGWPPGTDNPYFPGEDYPPLVVFRGRVGRALASPHKLGMVYTLTCVDYTVDLAEYDAGEVDYPQEYARDRIARMFAEAGVENTFTATGYTLVYLAARTAQVGDLLALTTGILDTVADPAGFGDSGRAFLVPRYLDTVTSDTPDDPAGPYDLSTLSTRQGVRDFGDTVNTILPARLQLVGGLWALVIVTEAKHRSRVFSAGYTDFSATYGLAKNESPDVVTVTGTFSDGTKSRRVESVATPVPVRLNVKSELVDPVDAENLAALNLGGSDTDTDRWVADEFTYYADHDPHQLVNGIPLFNDALVATVQGYPALVDGIPAAQNPTGPTWYAGQLTGATFTLAKGRYTAKVRMRRNLRRALQTTLHASTGYLDYTHLAAAPYSDFPYTDLDPAFSYFDYRLLRSPDYA